MKKLNILFFVLFVFSLFFVNVAYADPAVPTVPVPEVENEIIKENGQWFNPIFHLVWISLLFLGLLFYAWIIKDIKLDIILRKRNSLWLMLLLALLLSAIWVGGWIIVAFPYVLLLAPVGIWELFFVNDPPKIVGMIFIGIVHIIFWTLFITLLSKIKKIDRIKLRIIWFILLLLIFLAMAGCSQMFYNM